MDAGWEDAIKRGDVQGVRGLRELAAACKPKP